jgi:hypothetical protein
MTGRARLAFLAALAGVVSVSAATADAPTRSLMPLPRGAAEVAAAPVPAPVPPDATANAPRASLRPLARGGAVALSSRDARPAAASAAAAAIALAADVPPPATTRPAAVTASTAPVEQSPRPSGRPEDLAERPGIGDAPDARTGDAAGNARDALRHPGAVGRPAGADHGSKRGMRHRRAGAPARRRRHPLTTPATINCDAARALQTWVREGLVPAVGRTGGGVANLRVVASYACRTRNSQSGARLSEHARRQRHRHRRDRSGQWRAS